MRIRTLAASALAAAALSTLAPAAAPAAAPVSSASARCEGIDLDFTVARVTTRRLPCSKGRKVLQRWFDTAKGGTADRKRTVAGYRCTFSGTDAALKLRCARGSRVVVVRRGG